MAVTERRQCAACSQHSSHPTGCSTMAPSGTAVMLSGVLVCWCAGCQPISLHSPAAARQLTDFLSHARSSACRPVLVSAEPGAAQALGIALPEGSLTVDRLASKIGLPFEVRGAAPGGGCESGRWQGGGGIGGRQELSRSVVLACSPLSQSGQLLAAPAATPPTLPSLRSLPSPGAHTGCPDAGRGALLDAAPVVPILGGTTGGLARAAARAGAQRRRRWRRRRRRVGRSGGAAASPCACR